MTHIRRPSRNVFLIAAFATALAPGQVAHGADSDELEELRREVRRMQGEVEALRAAVTQATELERQRAAILSRAIGERASAPPPAPPPAVASVETASGEREVSAAPATTVSKDRSHRGKRHRHHRSRSRGRSKPARVADL